MRNKKRKHAQCLTTGEAHEAEVLRCAIKTAIKELDIATLRTLLRVIRYTEEGKTPVAVAREGLQDRFLRKINLDSYIDEEKL